MCITPYRTGTFPSFVCIGLWYVGTVPTYGTVPFKPVHEKADGKAAKEEAKRGDHDNKGYVPHSRTNQILQFSNNWYVSGTIGTVPLVFWIRRWNIRYRMVGRIHFRLFQTSSHRQWFQKEHSFQKVYRYLKFTVPVITLKNLYHTGVPS